MNVRLTDRYELRSFDSMNMQLWEHREVDGKDGRRVDWMPCGSYFPDVPSAVAFVFMRMQRDDPYAGDLAGALLRMEEIAGGLRKAVAA